MIFIILFAVVVASETETGILKKLDDKDSGLPNLENVWENVNEQDMRIKYLEDKLLEQSELIETLRRSLEMVTNVLQESSLAKDVFKKENVKKDAAQFETVSSREENDNQQRSTFISHRLLARSLDGQHISFSAYLSHTVDHIASGQIIKCDAILLNDGNAYNPETGTFTAPESGVYMFTFAIGSSSNAYVKLVVDGRNTADALVRTPRTNQTTMAGNTILVRVGTGQTVWLESYITDDGNLVSYGPFIYTTFSGLLVY